MAEELAASDLVMAEVIRHCTSDACMDSLSEFKREHRHSFSRCAESKCPEDEVHDVLFTKLFEDYQAIIEEAIEKVLRRHNVDIRQFYSECKDIVDGKFTPLFQEHEHQWFIDLLHSWMEYMTFFNMMVEEAGRSNRK
jgi:hypothetical protein